MAETIVEGVRKRYSRRGPWVLDGVDLTVAPGVITVVAAGNGAGKSTLLRIVAGASAPTVGRVLGRPGTVAYIPERAPVRLRMTARQYAAHMGRLRGLRADVVRTRAAELFERLKLAPGPDVPIMALSKGNSRKVTMVQAFLRDPDLLVVDEPYAGLDAPAGRELRGLLGEAAERGTAVLVSAHERTAAAGELFLLRDGRVSRHVGPPGGMMRLVLLAVAEHASAGDLAGFAADTLEENGHLVLRTADADRLLRHALANGWSLLEARPESP